MRELVMTVRNSTGAQVEPITVLYINYRGETAVRRFLPREVYFGTTPHHTEPQWLVHGYDLDKQLPRTYALRDMRPAPEKVRVYFKDKNYMDVTRDRAQDYETQQDYDRTEEIPQ